MTGRPPADGDDRAVHPAPAATAASASGRLTLVPARSIRDRVSLVVGFLLVHGVLGWLCFSDAPNQPAGDVTGVYRFWVDYWHTTGVLVGIGTDWVYPIAALPPMLLAGVFGDSAYLATWLVMVALLDAVAIMLLARRSRGLAWWWLAFALLLGPVGPSRIDAVALPFAVVAVLVISTRPVLATVLLTVAAWIKVWPAAMVVTAVLHGQRRALGIAAAALTSAAIVVLALIAGARGTVFSFVSAQATRGLQVEAPASLPWLWSAALGDPSASVYYDTGILTFQVRGDGVPAMIAVMTPVLAVGMVAVLGLGLIARLRGAPAQEVLAITSLGAVSALIALNKVGSPQYLTWYVAPILLGLLTVGARFRAPAVMALVAAGLTQLIYPWFYAGVTTPEPVMISVLTLRNGIEVALLVWSLLALRTVVAEARIDPDPVPGSQAAPGASFDTGAARSTAVGPSMTDAGAGARPDPA